MKIQKSTLMICLLFLCCVRFFMTGAYTYGIYYLDMINMMLLAWCVLGIAANGFKIPLTKEKNGIFSQQILWFWILILVEIVYTYFTYGLSLQSISKMAYFYLILGVYFILIYLIDSPDKLEQLKKFLVLFCTACNFYQIFNSIVLSSTWNPYFYLMLLSFPIGMTYIVHKEYTHLAWVHMITSVICIFLIGENTAVRIVFSTVAAVALIYNAMVKIKKESDRMLTVLIFTILAVILLLSGFVGNLILEIINNNVGNQIRVYAIEYYWEQFLQRPILGLGLVDPSAGDWYYTLLHGGMSPLGGTGQYYLEDVGVVGYLAQFGLVGIVILAWILKSLYMTVKKTEGKISFQNLEILCLMAVMFISLMPLNKAPIQMMPIALAIVSKNYEFHAKNKLM